MGIQNEETGPRDNDQQVTQEPGGGQQPVGLNETGRTDGDQTGQTEQIPGEAAEQENSSEGEPGRAAADSTGGQPAAGNAQDGGDDQAQGQNA